MQKQKNILIAGILIIMAAESLYSIVKSEVAKITNYEECIKAGWLVRSIKIYDGFNPIEAECILWSGKSFEKRQPNNNPQINVEQKNASKIDDQEEVKIIVTPVDFSVQLEEWEFIIVVSTHSVELDQDMAKISVMIDDQGKEYKPLRWEGDPIGGHHRKGALIFEQINSDPRSIKLKISGIGNIIRNFSWQLK